MLRGRERQRLVHERRDVLDLLAGRGAGPVDLPIALGVYHRLPARLLAARVPEAVAAQRRRRARAEARDKGRTASDATPAWCAWTALVTNAPAGLLALDDAFALLRARWQVELLFKLWKLHGHVDESRSARPWRVLCDVFAKLLALVVQHGLLLTGCWAYPDRSLTKSDAGARGDRGDPHVGIPLGEDVGAATGVGMARHDPSLINELLPVIITGSSSFIRPSRC